MLPDSILPTPEDDIARILRDYEKRLSHLERLENGGQGLGARVFNSASISVPDGAGTILTFDSERFDNDTIHSTVLNTSRLTATTAGKYQISLSFNWASNNVGLRVASIVLNGVTAIVRHSIMPVTGTTTNIAFSTLYEFVAGDFIEVDVFQNSGGALNVEFVPNASPEFMMIMVGG